MIIICSVEKEQFKRSLRVAFSPQLFCFEHYFANGTGRTNNCEQDADICLTVLQHYHSFMDSFSLIEEKEPSHLTNVLTRMINVAGDTWHMICL